MSSEIMIASETEGVETDTLSVAVIGTGAIAQRLHIPAYQRHDRAEVVAVCDVEEQKAAAVAEEHGVGEYYTDYAALLNDGIADAISVCLPNHLHRDVVVAALERDVHVLCEKPISTSLAEADEMVAAADVSEAIFMVDQTERFNPVYEKTKEILEKGIVGDVHNVRSRFSHPGPEGWSPRSAWFTDADASGGGALIDIGIHNADLLNYLFGSVTELMGYSDTLSMDTEVEDTSVAVLRFADGALGTFETAWRTDPESIRMQIIGEEGVVYVDKVEPSVRVEFGDNSGELDVPVPDRSRHGGPISHFIACALTGEEPTVTGRDGRKALEIVMGVYQSSKSRRAAELPLSREGSR
ncbi:Gfo/Idh/MocA family protein [Halegenticoccus tardaugens]|uniref:Gfo/Idh/MocA family protein n=1 Tax=Halegenticoccus tardaugens TaxID=2071624 RepID=UPI00100BE4FA|nr:Gfo/Idh/MocA family oxidoreductase [Halegenticoccus tardaugens]